MFSKRAFFFLACLVGFSTAADAQLIDSLTDSDSPPLEDTVEAEHLGSTATLDQIGRREPERAQLESEPWRVVPVGEPTPALAYRFWPPERVLKPGSAQLHFYRAIGAYLLRPSEERLRMSYEFFGERPSTDPEALARAVASLELVYDELHQLARSESFEWDHRWRDLKGPEIYEYLLHDVQEARNLTRLLTLKIDHQLAEGDFDGAFESISDGYRLAAFVCNGETLVQQLVGIAISSIMRDKVETAIQQPGCPNLYWALATLPRPISDLRRSLQIELGNLHRIFPMLDEAERQQHDEQYWNQQSELVLDYLRRLGAEQSDLNKLGVAAEADARAAKQRLRKRGIPRAQVDQMLAGRAILFEASLELKELRDNLEKTSLLPYAVAHPLLEDEERAFQEWLEERGEDSTAAAIASMLLPATTAARHAETRDLYLHHRLMTVEALRMHAAEHGGRLPGTLAELKPAPALPNPFTGEPFKYQVQEVEEGQLVTLEGEIPERFDAWRKVELLFPKAR